MRKRSAAMLAALALVAQGIPIREAARRAGVWHTGLHRAIKQDKGATCGNSSPASR